MDFINEINSNPFDLMKDCYSFAENPNDEKLTSKILTCLNAKNLCFNVKEEEAIVFSLVYKIITKVDQSNNNSLITKIKNVSKTVFGTKKSEEMYVLEYFNLKRQKRFIEAYGVLLKIERIFGKASHNSHIVHVEKQFVKEILEKANTSHAKNSPELKYPLSSPALSHKAPLHQHFLVPNELTPRAVYSHLNKESGGIHVCTGTERLFMNAVICPTERDEFIGVDLDPQVIAYNHYNTLLLRLAKNREDFYNTLAPLVPCEETYDLLSRRIYEDVSIPHVIKLFYLENLKDFCPIYLKAKKEFFLLTSINGNLVAYHRDDEAFSKLQRFAREGRFVFFEHNINQLEFLEAQKVREVDTSNIGEYTPIDIKFKNSKPSDAKIIWTTQVGHPRTLFHSCEHKEMPKYFDSFDTRN